MRTELAFSTTPGYEVAGDGGCTTMYAPVLDLGRPARDKLARGRRWTTIARFRRSIYIRNEYRDIVCLCGLSIDPGPLNVRYALPESIDWRRLAPGSDAAPEFDGDSFGLGKSLRFHFGRARIWRPLRVHGVRSATAARLSAVLEAAAVRAPDAGLGAAFRPARKSSATGRLPISDGVLHTAVPAAKALAWWLEQACARQKPRTLPPPAQAIELVGLGPGLTPSGDDYLGGLMIGLHAMNRSDLATGLARLVLPVAGRGTGAVSYAHLACAAEGQGGAALHRTIEAFAGPDPHDIGPCLDAVARMGATSGWDALAGAVLPFRIHFGIRSPAPDLGS
jgi:hypothetical protein